MTRFERYMLILLAGEFVAFCVGREAVGITILGCMILIHGAREIILDLKK